MSSSGTGNVHILPSYTETTIPSSVTEGRRKVVIALDQSEVCIFCWTLSIEISTSSTEYKSITPGKHAKYALAWSLDHMIQPASDVVILMSVMITPESYFSAVTESTQERDKHLKERGERYAKSILDEASRVIGEHSGKLGAQAKVYTWILRVFSKFFTEQSQLTHQICHEIFCLSSGDPRSVIVDFCRNQAADLLVVGSRGLGTIQK